MTYEELLTRFAREWMQRDMSIPVRDDIALPIRNLMRDAMILRDTLPIAKSVPSQAQKMEAEDYAELIRLREAVRGPGEFATWQDAATDERMRRVKMQEALMEARSYVLAATTVQDYAARKAASAALVMVDLAIDWKNQPKGEPE